MRTCSIGSSVMARATRRASTAFCAWGWRVNRRGQRIGRTYGASKRSNAESNGVGGSAGHFSKGEKWCTPVCYSADVKCRCTFSAHSHHLRCNPSSGSRLLPASRLTSGLTVVYCDGKIESPNQMPSTPNGQDRQQTVFFRHWQCSRSYNRHHDKADDNVSPAYGSGDLHTA